MRPDGARLFVINQQSSDVSVVDTATNAVAATVTVGFGPSGMGSSSCRRYASRSFTSPARKCQAAVSRQGIKLATLEHGLEAACRLGVIKAEAAGKGTAGPRRRARRPSTPAIPPRSSRARA